VAAVKHAPMGMGLSLEGALAALKHAPTGMGFKLEK